MGEEERDRLRARLEELEAKVAIHERSVALCDAVDARLEEALRERQPLERVVPPLLGLLCDRLGAVAGAVCTLDESLAERIFSYSDVDVRPEDVTRTRAERTTRIDLGEAGWALGQRLDVGGEDFGVTLCYFGAAPEPWQAELLHRFCEHLDNHLAAVAQSRRRYEVIRSISDALKEPVLDRGIGRAFGILRRWVDFQDLVLIFRHEDDLDAGAIGYKVYRDGALVHDSADVRDEETDAFIRSQVTTFFDGDDAELRERFGIRRYREEVLITGVRAARVIGRMLVTSRQGEFHTYDRELLDRFADYLRQRIVDFNREWKQLSVVFSRRVCERLLSEEGYVERWLTPREGDAAILYGDIAGFTRLSEQVLKTPEAIGRLIHVWVTAAVEIIWDTGGVFDKMVGDCVIGLWGPPFFEGDAADRCERALEAARRIQELTRSLIDHAELPEIASLDRPLDVAIGVNFCPLSVGLFGPNDDYTGFSSGMNNTARLQGLARGGEILCMEPVVAAIGDGSRFGEREAAAVKNVAEPLRYRPLR